MSKHTPGPWEVAHWGGWPCILAGSRKIASPGGYTIRELKEDASKGAELEADAHLIAAAPDYDAAAKAIFRAVESNAAPMNVEYVLRQMMVEGKRIELDTDLLLDLFAAIAKAESGER